MPNTRARGDRSVHPPRPGPVVVRRTPVPSVRFRSSVAAEGDPNCTLGDVAPTGPGRTALPHAAFGVSCRSEARRRNLVIG